MKTKTFTITEEQVKRIDVILGELTIDSQTRMVMRLMFPEAFEPEWKEVSLSGYEIRWLLGGPCLCDRSGSVLFFIRDLANSYKVEGGKLWWKKP